MKHLFYIQYAVALLLFGCNEDPPEVTPQQSDAAVDAGFDRPSDAGVVDDPDAGDGPYDSWAHLHDFTNLPMTRDGWTDLLAMYQHADYYNDSRIIYVSAAGDDSSAQIYSPGDDVVGDDPFEPVGAVEAFRTLSAAYAELRDGHPDLMLLKRGDVWDEEIPQWRKSGRGLLEPVVLGAYGSLEDPRPIVRRFSTSYGPDHPGRSFSHQVITSITFSDGVGRVIGGDNFLIEDVYVPPGAGNGFSLQGPGSVPLRNVALRRTVTHNRHSSADHGHVQGIYAGTIHGLLVEEAVFDHNGWDPDEPDAEATIFNHNLYIQHSCTDVTVRRIISARASSHGIHHRPGGLNEHNLYLQNALVQMGYSGGGAEAFGPFSGVFRQNVILDSKDIGTQSRGFGIRVEAADGITVEDNIIAHLRTGSGNREGISVGNFSSNVTELHRITIRDNVVYDWAVGGSGTAFRASSSRHMDNLLEGNIFAQPNGGGAATFHGDVDLSEYTLRDNTYWSTSDSPFGRGMSFADFRAATGENGSFEEPSFADPSRGLLSYMASLGEAAANEEEAMVRFLSLTHDQRRGNWRDELMSEAVIEHIREGFGRSGSLTRSPAPWRK